MSEEKYAPSWNQADQFLQDMSHSISDVRALNVLSQDRDLYPVLELEDGEYELKVEKSEGLGNDAQEKAVFSGELPEGYDLEMNLGL